MVASSTRRLYTVIGVLVVFGLLACAWPIRWLFPAAGTTGTLTVDINYTGGWYVETFGYARNAENIRHYVLVLPESETGRADAGAIFTSLLFPARPGDPPKLSEERPEVQWALDYLYEAPEGHFQGRFAPGEYQVAVVFIAAPLSRDEAGVGDDVILYAGITGGGASTDYRSVVIEAGQVAEVEFVLTDNNGWACPWLYVYDGRQFERRTEILRLLRGAANEQTEITPLGLVPTVNGAVILQIAEEQAEITFLDELVLLVGGIAVRADAAPPQLAERDQDYLILTNGEAYTFTFRLPDTLAGQEQVTASVIATGFYESVK